MFQLSISLFTFSVFQVHIFPISTLFFFSPSLLLAIILLLFLPKLRKTCTPASISPSFNSHGCKERKKDTERWNRGEEARKRRWGQHDFHFPCWLQTFNEQENEYGLWLGKLGALGEGLQHEILCPRGLQTDGRRSRLKSCMGLGEAVGLLVHTDLTATGHDIWSTQADEQEVMEVALILNTSL